MEIQTYVNPCTDAEDRAILRLGRKVLVGEDLTENEASGRERIKNIFFEPIPVLGLFRVSGLKQYLA
jgi:hypothetical protein